ncbi:MAG: SANT/Myb-like DNA-binding domain-containing protein [Cyanobacteria bacterium P01_H01_bin.105]
MPTGKKWSPEEEALLLSVFSKYPTDLAIAKFQQRRKKEWPKRADQAIRKRAYTLGMGKLTREDTFTATQLARELGLTDAKVRRWYRNSPFTPSLRVISAGSRVLTRKVWVQDFLWPHKIEGSRSYRLPHRFHLLEGVDDFAIDWLCEGNEELAQNILGFKYAPSPSATDYIHLQQAARILGVSRGRVWNWAKSNPPLVTQVQYAQTGSRQVVTTAQHIREFLLQPPANSSIDCPDRLHLVNDASVEGLRWIFQDHFTDDSELDTFLESVINRPNLTRPSVILKRSARDNRVLARYESLEAAARASYLHVHTVRNSIKGNRPPADQDFYFQKVTPVHQSLAARQLQEQAS